MRNYFLKLEDTLLVKTKNRNCTRQKKRHLTLHMTALLYDSKKLILILTKSHNNINNLKDLLLHLHLKRQITSISNFLAYSIIKVLIQGTSKLIISYKIWRKVRAKRSKLSYCIEGASRARMRRNIILRSQFWRRF